MISILLPSRGRPDNIDRLWRSLHATTEGDWELIVRLDIDDPAVGDYPPLDAHVKYLRGDRVVLSAYWNECHATARGPIFMFCGDDIVMRTPGWDRVVEAAFPPDGIAFVHGDDGNPDRARATGFGTHGFLRREWTDAVGYMVPPLFASDWSDVWLNDVADALGRRVYVDILTEHMHPAFEKAPLDRTHLERIARHRADDCDAIYTANAAGRTRDVERLRQLIGHP